MLYCLHLLRLYAVCHSSMDSAAVVRNMLQLFKACSVLFPHCLLSHSCNQSECGSTAKANMLKNRREKRIETEQNKQHDMTLTSAAELRSQAKPKRNHSKR